MKVLTRQAVPGGYKDTRGYNKPLTLANESTMTSEHVLDTVRLEPQVTPGPEPRWVSNFSDQGKGRPTIARDRYIECPSYKQMDFNTVKQQTVRSHQRGYSSTNEGIHGAEDYPVTIKTYSDKLIEPNAEEINWEASRFKWGYAEVPGDLGYNLKGSLSTLQRNQNFITTGFYKPRGQGTSGYRTGLMGIKTKFGIDPT